MVVLDSTAKTATVTLNGDTVVISDALTVDTMAMLDCYVGISAGSSEAITGVLRSASVDDFYDYDFTTYTGKTTSEIEDLSGNGNSGTLVPTVAGVYEPMWATRYKDAAGVVVDSANYLPIEWVGGYTSNNSECSIIQTAQYAPSITVSGTGMLYDGISDGRPAYVGSGARLAWESAESSWTFRIAGALNDISTVNSYNPPTTGWGSITVVLAASEPNYDAFGGASFWGDGSSWTEKSYADLLAEPSNTTNGWYKWVNINGVCHLKECFQYNVNDVLTEAEYDQNVRYIGDGGGCGSIAPQIPTYLTITVDGTKHLATRDDDATSGYPTWVGTNLTVDWFDSAVDYWRIVYAGSLSDYDTSDTIPPEGSWDNMSPSTATIFVEWGNTMTPITHEGDIVTHEGDYLYN